MADTPPQWLTLLPIHLHTRPTSLPSSSCAFSSRRSGLNRPAQDTLRDFSRSFRWSAGAGLVLPTVFGRFEANYVVVMSHQDTDKLKRGLQLGFVASSLM